jgi:SAM-dependent methyltransferase
MVDAAFEHPCLAAIYDLLDPDRSDLDAYLAMAEEFGARSMLDIGCGTGVFALLLAERGITVTGIDPALASVDVARGKPGAGRVRWLDGDAGDLPPLQIDLVTMTGNVAQAIADPSPIRRHGVRRCAARTRRCGPAGGLSSHGSGVRARPAGGIARLAKPPAAPAGRIWHGGCPIAVVRG